jgi:hypothetical protein
MPTIRYKDFHYRVAELPSQKYFRGDGVLFWIYAVVTSQTGTNLPIKGTQLKRIPKEIAHDITLLERAAISEAIEANQAWFLKLEEVGWEWRERKGDKEVPTVQKTLEWLYRFNDQATVDGSRLLYLEINNKLI